MYVLLYIVLCTVFANMSQLDIQKFVEKPSIEAINELKKSELLDIGKHYNLDVRQALRKHEIKKIVVEFMTDENILPESALKCIESSDTEGSESVQMLQMKFDHQLKLKDMELRMKEFELEQERLKAKKADQFDVSKHLKLIPHFDEKDVDQFLCTLKS